ncbi:hypothetical protein [Actinomyces ruminicola]|uniref:hypothetical protein n=1 Tax=Actinomyces ruminicola TaxID=332524 RepID=UPI0021C28ACB|nr:hypothetical protein [Actinomyces ruminicola]
MYMIVDEQDLLEALARLELEGGDCLDLEAKTFSEYSRDALGPTLSAFANLPGGGTLLLGVSENPVEEHQLLIRHQRPSGDTIPIPNTSINNLDADLVKGFVRNARAGSTALRDQSDAEVLLNLNILTEEGTATLAGLYALGSYPQRHFPVLAITAAGVGDEGGPRATDRLRINGPIHKCSRRPLSGCPRTHAPASSSGRTGMPATCTSTRWSPSAS